MKEETIKKEGFNWGKLSFRLSIASLVFFGIYILGVLTFHASYPEWDGSYFNLPLIVPSTSKVSGMIDKPLWLFSSIIVPIIAIINLICILICSIKIRFKYKNYKHKRYILHGFIISSLLLVFYLYIFNFH